MSLKEDLEEPEGMTIHDGEAKQRDVLTQALGLFGLEQYRLMYEPATDSKALIAWREGTILISFRGTASMKAAKLDLKVCVS